MASFFNLTLDTLAPAGLSLILNDGAQYATSATVTATVKSHGRADKVRIVKFRRRKHHRKQMGHRQHYTEIEITGIGAGDKK